MYVCVFVEEQFGSVTVPGRYFSLPTVQYYGGASICSTPRGHDHIYYWLQHSAAVQRGERVETSCGYLVESMLSSRMKNFNSHSNKQNTKELKSL